MPSIIHEVSLIFSDVRGARPMFIEFLKSCDNLQYQTKIFAAKGRDAANMITAVAKLQMSPEIGTKYTKLGQDLQGIFTSFDDVVSFSFFFVVHPSPPFTISIITHLLHSVILTASII